MTIIAIVLGACCILAAVLALAACILSSRISRWEESHPWQPRARLRVVR